MARLLSVNVGLPRDIAWQGKTVHTAVWKAPAQGRRMVRRLNIDGDAQGDLAGHGGEHRAVFVYQIDSYRYWQSQLGRGDSSTRPRQEVSEHPGRDHRRQGRVKVIRIIPICRAWRS
jgi:MOSC domain-containing protein YiiM